MNGPIDKLHFNVNPQSNGGECVSIDTHIFKNEDGGLFLNTEISLQSYCNHAKFLLVGAALSPAILRDLANKLDEKMSKLRT